LTHETKAQLRHRFRRARRALPAAYRAEASARIHAAVLALPEVRAADSIFVYVSVGSEVDTHPLIQTLLAQHKQVAIPHITDFEAGKMIARRIASAADLVIAPASVPKSSIINHQSEITLLPALAFSPTTGHRLGQGRGFYDRYLAPPGNPGNPGSQDNPTEAGRPRNIFPVGLAFTAQLHDPLPTDPHDQPVQALITEDQVFRFSP
jgi:5-formyltetrahydrofolate cyclo-ligase